MLTVAYLANRFPVAVEPYVADEIDDLRSRGVHVVACSVLDPRADEQYSNARCFPEIILFPLQAAVFLRAMGLCIRRWSQISSLVKRVLFRGRESLLQRAKALVHTWLGLCLAVRLQEHAPSHIHVHHGFFGSWIAMVAARVLDVRFSMTLHGSDLLIRREYLDVKLACCAFCLTVSEFNRRHILEHFPEISPGKILTAHLGVEVPEVLTSSKLQNDHTRFSIVAVGRLHAVKDHAFLVRACAALPHGMEFECAIAGEGPERRRLQSLIRELGLEQKVSLLGHVRREQMDSLYDRADVVVLTSRSEGIPLVLMEAMARGKVVLAPAITGIPELVIAGKTGFLYTPASQQDFLMQLLFIRSLCVQGAGLHRAAFRPGDLRTSGRLDWMRHAARTYVNRNFNRKRNLESFANLFLRRISPQYEAVPHENLVLQ